PHTAHTLSLHDALPISLRHGRVDVPVRRRRPDGLPAADGAVGARTGCVRRAPAGANPRGRPLRGTRGAGRAYVIAMTPTIRDVAALAGVSFKTVSNVVNDYPHVAPATRERVMAAIRELGYQPNRMARSMRTGRTGAIGLAVPELSLAYFAE